MADKMTLMDVRDWHRKCATMYRRTNEPALANLHNNMADALDAHLAAMGEPVAWQMTVETHKKKPKWRDCSFKEYTSIAATGLFVSPDGLTFPAKARVLYTDQPASGDWDKVREVIAILDADGDEWGCAAKLTAALPEPQP